MTMALPKINQMLKMNERKQCHVARLRQRILSHKCDLLSHQLSF